MKINFLIVTILSLGFLSCNNNSTEKSEISTDLIENPITASGKSDMKDLPIIKFEKETHDFGLILQGERVSYTFKFKNIGNKNLIVNDASASCGCTVPKFSRKPIAPGDSGEIEVIFDSNRRSGKQLKSVTVWTNCQPNQIKLQIKSEIVLPK